MYTSCIRGNKEFAIGIWIEGNAGIPGFPISIYRYHCLLAVHCMFRHRNGRHRSGASVYVTRGVAGVLFQPSLSMFDKGFYAVWDKPTSDNGTPLTQVMYCLNDNVETNFNSSATGWRWRCDELQSSRSWTHDPKGRLSVGSASTSTLIYLGVIGINHRRQETYTLCCSCLWFISFQSIPLFVVDRLGKADC